MSGFEPIEIEWNGKAYTIKPNNLMPAIAAVEDVVTFGELYAFFSRQSVPLAKVAMAYGVLLRKAGAKVTDAEVYEAMFSGGNAQETVMQGVQVLMQTMMPPSARAETEAVEAAESGTANPPKASQKPRSRQP